MSVRDTEILEAIRRDDLSYLITTRYQGPLHYLDPEDTHTMLMDHPSALMVAAFYGATKCFKFLLNKLDTNYRDRKKRHIIHFVAAGGNLSLFSFCEGGRLTNDVFDVEDNTPLHYAAKFGRVAIVQAICAQGCAVKDPNRYGWTAGHFAAANGNHLILQELFDMGDGLVAKNAIICYFYKVGLLFITLLSISNINALTF